MMGAEAPPTGQFVEAVLLDALQRQKLLAYARSRGIGVEDAEDILQDTLLQLLRQRPSIRNPNGFFFAVFRARCARFQGSHQASRALFSTESPAREVMPRGADPEEIDERVALREALREVSSLCRRLLCAYYIEGQSLREAALTSTLAYSGASNTIHRCLRRLRECLN
ncbi:MAG TPA: sigma-70 family RNA polymerase sigma factor [Thermoanaerobaculia bacterium]|nr:sigma-70 family RNA polymerase sigma factor [Thermoanaerobaculia bacterium]